MKATGEVMAIGSNVESALLKAVRSLETGHVGLWDEAMSKQSTEQLLAALPHADDLRLFNIAETLRRGVSIEKVHELTGIQPYFLQALHNIIEVEEEVRRGGLRPDIILKAKQIGLSDATIARLAGTTESYVRRSRQQAGIVPVYRKVDTCAPFFKEAAPYYYSSYHGESEAHSTGKSKVIVLGSGPIRIGQGIEFDYSSVHAVQALQKLGYEAIIVNNNPETVSTDFDTADRLYFEPLTLEDVLDIIEQEQPYGVICQFGGQTAINLAAPLANAGVYVLGTTVADMDRAEDRDKFDQVLASVNIPRPAGQAVTTPTEAIALAERIGYPVVVRPSYVLGGRAMEIVHNDRELTHYLATAVQVSPMHPVWIDRYLNGMEIEVDAVSDGTTVVIPGIMEHIERAGVHSGDSVAVYPPLHADTDVLRRVVEYTEQLARSLRIVGMCNIQFVVHDGEIYVLEVNPRASRTVPILTKATGVPLVQLATQAILGRSLSELGFSSGLVDDSGIVAVKIPIFSWGKLTDVDAVLGPEMKSTGEVMGIARDFASAMAKGMLAAGMDLPQGGGVLMTIADRDKEEATSLASQLAGMGYRLYATRGTARHLQREGITVETVDKLNEGQPNLLDLMNNGQVHLIINTYTRGKEPERDGFRIRRYAVERGIPCLTSLDTARAIIQVIASGGAIHRNPLVLHEAVPDRSRKENEV